MSVTYVRFDLWSRKPFESEITDEAAHAAIGRRMAWGYDHVTRTVADPQGGAVVVVSSWTHHPGGVVMALYVFNGDSLKGA